MKRMKAGAWAPLWILGVVIGTAGGTTALAQAPPSRPAHVGNLELVASLMGDQPAGVAISGSGRLFVTFPRHDGPVPFTVGEIKGGHLVPYPNAEINHAATEHPADTLFSVQTLLFDAANRLWMLDTGTLQFGQPPVKGASKLVAVDLESGRVLRNVVIPTEALVPNSALKDFRFDFTHGAAGVVFITDSAPGFEALIVLDLASGHAMRRLTGSPAVSAHPGRTPIVGYQPLLDWPEGPGKSMKGGAPKPWLVGLNALELSADHTTLYFSAFTGRRLYSVGTDDLIDPTVDNGKVVGEATGISDIGMAGHFALDTAGRLYFMDMEQNAIFRRTSDGRIETVVMDPRLIWPDTMAIGTDGYLYVTTSQQDLRAEFHDGEELRQHPYGVFRVFIGSQPVRPSER
jgi:sugar lactone lactonase YvrE